MSGGLDCTVATSIISKDHEIHAITFNYGQKALEREVKTENGKIAQVYWIKL